jgi:hypothetical protein
MRIFNNLRLFEFIGWGKAADIAKRAMALFETPQKRKPAACQFMTIDQLYFLFKFY